MNCDDYLSMLSTVPVEELSYGGAREHASGCRDCDRVTRVVIERERSMLLAYGDLHSSVPAAQVAERAFATSQRRRIGRYYEFGLAFAVVSTIAVVIFTRYAVPSPVKNIGSASFPLQCLSAERAAALIQPLLQAHSSMTFQPASTANILNIRATQPEMATVRLFLDHYDNAAKSTCSVPLDASSAPAGTEPPPASAPR